tara:strand:+ start:5259 stop:5966 length:708 start_codon:yes stop_codon:yes gene_type:complete
MKIDKKNKIKKIIAIIPARGNSKRLPRKNILPLGRVPLLSRVIRTAKSAMIFDEIIVSSEDKEILNIARKEGATIHKRKNKLSTDSATVVETCLDVLSEFSTQDFCCVYATAALISKNTLRKAFNKFYSTKKLSVLMGVSNYNFHPFQALKISGSGDATVLFSKYNKLKSNFYPETRVSNGTFYWAKCQEFKKEKTFYTKNLKTFDVPENEVSDINTPHDYVKLLKNFKITQSLK